MCIDLRELLRGKSEELWETLRLNRERAKAVYAAIALDAGSSNAEIHISSVEAALQTILSSHAEVFGDRILRDMSAGELYLLLAATCLHDIGRAKGDQDHGAHSESLIGQRAASLGLLSPRLAKHLAMICGSHDKTGPGLTSRLEESLRPTYLEPYGILRLDLLAILLILADEMSDSYTRVPDDSLVPSVGHKASFRRRVAGVEIDFAKRAIFSHFRPLEEKSEQEFELVGRPPESRDRRPRAPLPGRTARVEQTPHETKPDLSLPGEEWTPELLDVLLGRARVKIPDRSDSPGCIPDSNGFAIAMLGRAVREKNARLDTLNRWLEQYELPIKKWLIAYEGNVYDADGHIRAEPSLSRALLTEVLGAIRQLTTASLEREDLPIAQIQHEIGERDGTKVVLAVKRLCAFAARKKQTWIVSDRNLRVLPVQNPWLNSDYFTKCEEEIAHAFQKLPA